MKNLMFINSICTNFLEFIKPWFVSLNINWIEIILPGAFTLLGAGLGAFLAGLYTILTMKKQLKYNKINKELDLLDNHLKVNQRFSTLLSSDIESLRIFFDMNNMDEDTEGYNDILIITLENTIHYLEETYQNLSKLNIDNVPYEEYQYYIEALDTNKEIQRLCTIQMSNFEKIKQNQENGLKDNPFALNFLRETTEKSLSTKNDKVIDSHKSINEKQKELIEKNTYLQKELKKLT